MSRGMTEEPRTTPGRNQKKCPRCGAIQWVGTLECNSCNYVWER